MPTIFEGLGTEQVVDEVFCTLREQFNDALAVMQVRGDELDQARADRLGVDTVPVVTLEPVDLTPRDEFPYGNYHLGSIPSFVQTEDREINYPMLVVTAGRTIPDPENMMMDHYDVLANGVAIHSFGRANPLEGPTIAYHRTMRMAEAVHRVVNSTSLRRIVSGASGPVLVDRSEPWMFPSQDGHGDDWCWMAIMHQYQLKNYSQLPQ